MQMLVELVEVAKVVAKDAPLVGCPIELSLAPAVLPASVSFGRSMFSSFSAPARKRNICWSRGGAGLGLGLFLIDRSAKKCQGRGRLAMLAMGLAIGALAVVLNVTGVLLSDLNVSRTVGASSMTVPISFGPGIATTLNALPINRARAREKQPARPRPRRTAGVGRRGYHPTVARRGSGRPASHRAADARYPGGDRFGAGLLQPQGINLTKQASLVRRDGP